MRALSPDTLVSQLLAGLLGGSERGGLAEQVARQTVRERLAAFRAAVEAEVRRRSAAEKGREKVARSAVRPLADQVDFLRAQQADLAELRRTIAPLARRLAVRLSARRRHGREGRLDFRKTVRASLGTGGVPVVTHHRPRKVHKPELVVLCAVSGSVAGFSHFTLMLTQALREHFTGVRAFAFVDSTDEVTRFFRPGADVADAVARIGREADVVAFDGHSDYGNAFEVFAERWPSALRPKSSLLVLGDGRTNYRRPGVPVLADMVKRARSVAGGRIGVMGGTFDPIHHGHLVAASEVAGLFGLDEVVFVPTGQPWQKSERGVSPAEDRYLMTVIATASNPRFSVSRVDIDRGGPTYTIDSLTGQRAQRPDADRLFSTGADAPSQILRWPHSDGCVMLANSIGLTCLGRTRAGGRLRT